MSEQQRSGENGNQEHLQRLEVISVENNFGWFEQKSDLLTGNWVAHRNSGTGGKLGSETKGRDTHLNDPTEQPTEDSAVTISGQWILQFVPQLPQYRTLHAATRILSLLPWELYLDTTILSTQDESPQLWILCMADFNPKSEWTDKCIWVTECSYGLTS